MQLSMVGGEQNAGLGDVQSVNKKFLKTSSLLTSDFTAPLDPTGLTSSTHSYDERTTFWALIEDQRQHAHNHCAHLCRYASSKAHRSRPALFRAQTWRARCMRVALCRWRLELPWSPQLKSWTKGRDQRVLDIQQKVSKGLSTCCMSCASRLLCAPRLEVTSDL